MKPRLYLVDAHAYLHRAYHVLVLNNSKGEPVGALFGFARALLQIMKREKPDALAVCFDHPEPTFRHKAYEQYKATRKEIDEDLVGQLKRALPMAEAMGLCCVECPGFEADDIMATLARRGVKQGYDVVLVTGDKDALQMVSPGIRVLRDVTNSVWMDPPQVEAKYGIKPSQVVDYLALIGDASDNVPGVRGIGPAGASKLLGRFGALPEIFKAAKKGDPFIKPAQAQALLEGEKDSARSLELLRLRQDAPLKIDVDDCRKRDPDPVKLREAFEALEFGSLLKEMLGGGEGQTTTEAARRAPVSESSGGTAVAVAPAAAVAAVTEVSFDKLAKELSAAKEIYLTAAKAGDTLVDHSRVHLALGLSDGRVACLSEAEIKTQAAAIKKALTGKALKVGHHLKETIAALDLLGLATQPPYFDTLLAAYCLSPVRLKADAGEDGDWKSPLLARAGRALAVRELKEKMREEGVLRLFEDVEMPLMPVLRQMERAGVGVDGAYLKRLGGEFEAEISRLQRELDDLAGFTFNVNSPKQLGELLYDKLGLPVLHKTAKGGRSTDEECLNELSRQHPLPGKVLEYRELSKLKSTYIDGLLARLDAATGRVHTRLEQTGAETGRLSSVDPNLQNIPVRSAAGQKIRRAFVAGEGRVFVAADYSQIDLRVLAEVSKDPVLRESFEKGEDIHTRTACEIFRVGPEGVDKEMRRRAKAVNFGIVYGQTPFGLAAALGIPQKEAAAIIHRYFERLPGVSRWIEANLEEARRTGRVRTFLGRVRQLPELAAKNTALRQFGERAARNTPIQGGSADIIKLAMLKVQEGLDAGKFQARMLLQIHDELLFEAPTDEVKPFAAWVKKIMEHAADFDVPLVVDVKAGVNWQDMEKLK